MNQAILTVIDSLIPKSARELHRVLQTAGHPTYIVGGWIRNILIAEKPNPKSGGDIDFATAATPEQVIALFPHTHPTGIKHGTVTVIIDNQAYEVTTFRREGKYSDNRRPEKVTFSQSLEEDLIRRDFTINAFAYDLEKKILTDKFDGIADLEKGLLRVISQPTESPSLRFQEDALRMMRACRLAAQFGFTIEAETLKAITDSAPLIEAISQERVRDELIKTVIAPKATVGLEYLRTTGILEKILPELSQTVGVTQNRFHAYDVYTHSLEVLKALNQIQTKHRQAPDYRLSLAGLFHDIAKPQTKTLDPNKIIEGQPHVSFHRHEILGAEKVYKIMKRLKFSKQDITSVTHLVRHHMFYYTSEWKDGTVRRFVSRIKPENLEPLFLLREADRLGKGDVAPDYQEDNQDLHELRRRIKELINETSFLTLADLVVDGDILMQEFSLPPGPIVGSILKQLLEEVLDDPQRNRKDYLLKAAQELLKQSNQ